LYWIFPQARMAAAEAKFNADGNGHRTVIYDALNAAKAEYKGHTNFSTDKEPINNSLVSMAPHTMLSLGETILQTFRRC